MPLVIERAPAFHNRTYIDCSDGVSAEVLTTRRIFSQDGSSLILNSSTHPKRQSDSERIYGVKGGVSSPEQSQNGEKPQHANSACPRCEVNELRCSSQRPTGRCPGEKMLKCTRGISKYTRKRASYKTGPVVGVDSGREASITTKKVLQVRSACMRCRKRKGRCTGERPICRYCSELGLDCSWDVSDGLTRTNDLKRRLREAANRSLELDRIFVVLRDGTDAESTEVLARLRLGDSDADVILSLTSDWLLHNNGHQ